MGVVSFTEGRDGLVYFQIHGDVSDRTVAVQCRNCPLEGNGCSGLTRRYSVNPQASIRRNYFEVRKAVGDEKFTTWCGILPVLRNIQPKLDLDLGVDGMGI